MNKIIAFIFFLILNTSFVNADVDFNDALGLNPTKVYKIIDIKNVEDIRNALKEARSKGLKISISGQRHAEGGQQSYPNGIVLDMLDFNKIISFDKGKKIIRVQSGVTWKEIQKYIEPYGYALRVVQDRYNFFTVGGSLSSNIHGNDPSYGTIIETVQSFRLMLANGRIIEVSRKENPDLFKLVIGGYGLFGVIVNVDLLLTDNVSYEKRSIRLDYKEYPVFFKTHILGNRNVGYSRAVFLNARKGSFNKLEVLIYTKIKDNDKSQNDHISRNRLMSVSRSDKFKPHTIAQAAQEYFIPVDKFVFFIDGIQKIFSQDNFKPVGMYTRYIPKDNQSFLSYVKVDSFGVGISLGTHSDLSAQELEEFRSLTRQIIDLALSCGGSYYLTKQLYLSASREQLLKAYPQFDDFIKKKMKYDPQEIFKNQFYQHYR